jgi:16S rRNA (cytidine1402-2'-O)-methyltransferase
MAHLVLVPTPIGNLADITLRALEVLKEADVIAAEDTRHSATLLTHHGISKPLQRLDAHTISSRAARLLEEYDRIAFITDAGTPGISDPGEELVRLALQGGHTVEALPGPTAFVPALVISGLPLNRFTFEGFLPRKGAARRDRLKVIAAAAATSIIYEAPGRTVATLRDLLEACGAERAASVSRELTKRFETTWRGSLAGILQQLEGSEVRGEVIICVGPASLPEGQESGAATAADFVALTRLLRDSGLQGRTLRDALTLAGAPRNLAYQLALQDE